MLRTSASATYAKENLSLNFAELETCSSTDHIYRQIIL
jgi:hypothetical protein